MTVDRDAQCRRAEAFRERHTSDEVVQIVNAWSATSARIAVAAGATVIGTTSFGVALDHGVMDGELLPFETAMRVGAEMAAAVDVPVTFDLEAGRGAGPDEVARSVAAVIGWGGVGVNIEDAVPGRAGELFPLDDQAARLAAARGAADGTGVPVFLNARCDVYFGASIEFGRQLDALLERAERYTDAGADGLFVPGLLDLETITRVTARVALPLNVMVGPGSPSLEDLRAAGVRRVSQGGNGFLAAAGAVKEFTERYLNGELEPPAAPFGAGFAVLPALVG